MEDLLTQAEQENKNLQSPDAILNEAEDTEISKDTPKPENNQTAFDSFATSIFEKISKPRLVSNFEDKETLWDTYKGRYETDYGENARKVFDAAYDKSAEYHKNLAMQELEDEQLSTVLDEAAWILPFDEDTERIDPSIKTTTRLETNSGRLQMVDWWTGATNSVREASVESKSYIDGKGEKISISDIDSLDKLIDTTDDTGKEIIGFQYEGASEYERGTSTLKAIYRGENPTGEIATVWDLKDSWLSNNGLTSNIAKTTVGSVMNLGMDILDTAYTLAAATAGFIDKDSDFYYAAKERSLETQQYSMGKSDYDQSKMFTVNNMVDMVVNTGLQLLLAGGVAGLSNSLAKMAISGAKKGAIKLGAKTAAKTLAEMGTKQYGAKAGLYLLAGMSSNDAYNESLKAGFNEKQAAMVYFASFAAMLQANKLSKFTDEAFGKIGSTKFGASAAVKVRKVLEEAVETKNVNSKSISSIANSIAKGTSKNIKKLYGNTSTIGAAFSEAMEEEAELVAQETINHLANMISYIGYKGDLERPKFKSVMDEGYWEEKGWEALMSGLGGAMGGAMASGVRGIRLRGSANKNVSEEQWPVQGNAKDDLNRLAFERARGTDRGKQATKGFLKTMEKEKSNGRFGREDYSKVWDSDNNRYKRMTELSPEELKTEKSQADILYNAIIGQFDHTTAMFSAYAGSYDKVIKDHSEIQGVYSEEALFKEVSDLLSTKQNILARSSAGSAPGVDAQLNELLEREDVNLDSIIKRSEVEVDRFIASRDQESAEAEESKETKKKKAETLKDGQPEEKIEDKEKLEKAVDSNTDKLLLADITKLAGALQISGGDMKSLLETQRKLKAVEDGKFVERGVINTLMNSSQFRNTIGIKAPKKYNQFGNIIESIINSDLKLKTRTNERKANGVRFTENFNKELTSMPSDLEGISRFIDSTDLPFLNTEQRAKMIEKIIKAVPSLETLKMETVADRIERISVIAQRQIGEQFIVVQDEGDTAKIMTTKVVKGAKALIDKIIHKYSGKDLIEVPSAIRKDVSDILHMIESLNQINAAKTTEDISRVTFDPEEVFLITTDEFGDAVSVEHLYDTLDNGLPEQLIDITSATAKVETPQELQEVDRLVAKVNKAEDPLALKEFEGDYFKKNINVTNTGLETIDQSLSDALKESIDLKNYFKLKQKQADGTLNEVEAKNLATIPSTLDPEVIIDLQQKIAIRKSQVELIQRAFKIISDVRGYNNELFVGGFDKSANDYTFFSNYVNEMIGDPLRYFELSKRKTEESITEEELEEFDAIHSIIGDPTSETSELGSIISELELLNAEAEIALSIASNSSEMLKQNYYVSTVNYLNNLEDSAVSALDDKLEDDKEAIALADSIQGIAANLDVSATEKGSIAALKSIVKIKEVLYKLGNHRLPSGKLVKENIGWSPNYGLALTSLYYDPINFNTKLKEVLETVSAGKTPADLKLPTVDQLIVAEDIAAHTTTSLNKYVRSLNAEFKLVKDLNLNVMTMIGLQGTGKTDIVAGLSASIIQKNLIDKYGGTSADHRILMSGNTENQSLKLHKAAKTYGVQLGSIDGNKSMNQSELYNLLVLSGENKNDTEHIAKLKAKLEGIDLIIYDEASWIEFLEKNPESSKDFPNVGVLNAMLYQLSKVNDIRGKANSKISVVLMGDKSQGGFMEGMNSPRNPGTEFSVTGKGNKGAIGSGSIPTTRELTKQFRFEVPSLTKDIEKFRQLYKPAKLRKEIDGRKFESSWNNISNDPKKLGGMKISSSWSKVCRDTETIENIRKQLEEDPEFDVIIITNGGIDSIEADSPLKDLAVEFKNSSRVEVASMYTAQGSEASYSIVNVPANMLVTTDEMGLPDRAEVNIVSMTMGRAKFFTQLAISGDAIDCSSNNETEIVSQSKPEVAMFRESWFNVLNEGLFANDMLISDASEVEDETVIEASDKTAPVADPDIIIDLSDKNVETPMELDLREKNLNIELGIENGTQVTIDAEKARINTMLKEDDLSQNKRNDLESRVNLLNNIDSNESDEDIKEALDDSYGNRNSNKKLTLAEKLGYVVFYSSRNLANGALSNTAGTSYQVNDTKRMFGSAMEAAQVGEHKLNAIGHNGRKQMDNYEYKLITYQFNYKNGLGINTGLFAKPKNSPGDWLMASSSIESSQYGGEFGTWLKSQEATLSDAYKKHLNDNTDITSEEYASYTELGNTAEIVPQNGTIDNNNLFAISRNIGDGDIQQLIQGTTAGSVETEPMDLVNLAKDNKPLLDIIGQIYGATGIDILKMKRGVNLRNRLTTLEVINRLKKEVAKKRPTEKVLKMDLFEQIDNKKVFEITIGEESLPVVFIKTARGVIPFIQQADMWAPFLGIANGNILNNTEVGINESKFYDAELEEISSNLDQILTDKKVLSNESIGFGHERMNTLVTSNLRITPELLTSGRKDIKEAIIHQFYKNLPPTLDKVKIPVKDAINLIKATSGNVTFSKPMIAHVGDRSGHSLMFYSTRYNINFDEVDPNTNEPKWTSEKLGKLYKTIAANRTADENDVDELLGLNRDGIGVIWLNQRGYNFSELSDIVDNTSTTLSNNIYQLTTWGNANDKLVGMFTALATVMNIHDESDRLKNLLDHFGDALPLAEAELWLTENQKTNPAVIKDLNQLLSYIFSTTSMGKVSTYYTNNNHINQLLKIQEESIEIASTKDMTASEKVSFIESELLEYINTNDNIPAVLKEYGITLEDLSQVEIATSKGDLTKGELVRNKKTGKPAVVYDVIRYIPSSIIKTLTGQDESIDPEINLVNLFKRLDGSKHKQEILGLLDSLLAKVPGMVDNIYASPYMSLNSEAAIEVGVSPDNGDLTEQLTTNIKMIADPGVALEASSIMEGSIFEDLKTVRTDNSGDKFKATKTTLLENSQALINELDITEMPEYVSVINELKKLKRSYNAEGDEKLVLDKIIDNSINDVNKRYDDFKAGQALKTVVNPLETNLMDHLGLSIDSDEDLALYAELNQLDFVRQKLLFDHASAEAYVKALNSINISAFITDPARTMDLTIKKETLVENMEKSLKEYPLITMTDNEVNNKLSQLDLDNPTKISNTFIMTLDPKDNSLEQWDNHKTSRPSIPHLYATLSNGDVDESVKMDIRSILRGGIGTRGKKLRIQMIASLNSGKFELSEYKGMLDELTVLEGQDAANTFNTSDQIKDAFEVLNISRKALGKQKVDIIKATVEEALNLKPVDRFEVLMEAKSALDVLLKNEPNLSNYANELLESVENSLKSSIITESHYKGELTTSQKMINNFENTKTYKGKGLSEEATRVFEEMRLEADKVPGLNLIQDYIATPTENGRDSYLKGTDEFKIYLRTKTNSRSVLKEFNALILESFCN